MAARRGARRVGRDQRRPAGLRSSPTTSTSWRPATRSGRRSRRSSTSRSRSLRPCCARPQGTGRSGGRWPSSRRRRCWPTWARSRRSTCRRRLSPSTGAPIGDPAAVGDLVRGAVAGGARPVGTLGRGPPRRHDPRRDGRGGDRPPGHRRVRGCGHAGPRPGRRPRPPPRRTASSSVASSTSPSTASTRRSGRGPRSRLAMSSARSPTRALTGSRAHVHVQRVAVPGLDAPRRGVPSLAAAWLELCPDPSSLLGILPGIAARPRDDPAALLARRDAVLATTQVHYFDAPPRIERGWRHHLVDTTGRAWLDMVNNVAVLGHSHPAVEAAVAAPAPPAQHELAVPLRADGRVRRGARRLLPGAAGHRLPRQHRLRGERARAPARPDGDRATRTSSPSRGAYHGWTVATDAITTSTLDNPRALETRPAWVHPVEAPNTFRGPHRGAGRRRPATRDDVRATAGPPRRRGPGARRLHRARRCTATPAASILPDGYLREAYAAVRARRRALRSPTRSRSATAASARTAGRSSSRASSRTSSRSPRPTGNGHAAGRRDHDPRDRRRLRRRGLVLLVGGRHRRCRARRGSRCCDAIDDEGLQANARDVGAHLRAGLRGAAARPPARRGGARDGALPGRGARPRPRRRSSRPTARRSRSASGCSSSG